jgi:dipeptidyl aminopeptidase/acylaminoacyl peptidase
MRKPIFLKLIVLIAVLGAGYFFGQNYLSKGGVADLAETITENDGGLTLGTHPLSIKALKEGEYPGSDIVIEQELAPGSNYKRYIASYKSEGLKIYALLTIPNGRKPESGWPVVIFNHGYIPPSQYKTTERYIAYTDAFSRNGYIVFRSDYRGHGNSEGTASSYGNNGYTIDVLNAIASLKRHPDVDENRMGMWGHSMGGHITLRNMVVSRDIKAGVIWAGVVASYPDMLARWRRGNSSSPSPSPSVTGRGSWRIGLINQFGDPQANPGFWNSISANSFLNDISGPIQLHHGTMDKSVPYEFSEKLHSELKSAGKESELFLYPGDDHDITGNFGTAMSRSVAFFDKYVKGELK